METMHNAAKYQLQSEVLEMILTSLCSDTGEFNEICKSAYNECVK